MAFVQAKIPVRDTEAYERLRGAIGSAFSAANVVGFLSSVTGKNLLIREFEAILKAQLLDRFLGDKSAKAADLYYKLCPTDQGQMREFYLTRIEEVSGELRRKYSKTYSYS